MHTNVARVLGVAIGRREVSIKTTQRRQTKHKLLTHKSARKLLAKLERHLVAESVGASALRLNVEKLLVLRSNSDHRVVDAEHSVARINVRLTGSARDGLIERNLAGLVGGKLSGDASSVCSSHDVGFFQTPIRKTGKYD
jgi:hypothetical protein